MTVHHKTKHGFPIEVSDSFIAGGAVLSKTIGQPINDIDIYPKSKDKVEEILHYLIDELNYEVVSMSSRAITIKSNIIDSEGYRMLCQVMIFDEFPTPQHIYDKFDFTVCMAAYDCDTKKYDYHPCFYEDVGSRRINFNTDTEFPYASLVRVGKYTKKGFSLSKGEFVKIGMSVARKGLPESWDELAEAIGGVYGIALKLGDNLPYTFDNAIEVLTNLPYPTREEIVGSPESPSEGLHAALKEVIKIDGLYNSFIQLYNGTYELDYVKFAGVSFVMEDGKFNGHRFGDLSSTIHNDHSYRLCLGTLSKQYRQGDSANQAYRLMFKWFENKGKFTMPEPKTMTIEGYVPVVVSLDESDDSFKTYVCSLNMSNGSKKMMIECVEGINNSIGPVPVFKRLKDAMSFYELFNNSAITLHHKTGRVEYIKASVSSENVTYVDDDNNIFFAKIWENKGL